MSVKIESLSRRRIRYLLYRLQTEKEGGAKAPLEAKAVYRYFKGQDAAGPIEDFSVTWDIGIDDLETMAMRPEKWWLFGINRLTAVCRKDHHKDLEEEGLRYFEAFGMGFVSVLSRKPFKARFNFTRFLDDMEMREQWP